MATKKQKASSRAKFIRFCFASGACTSTKGGKVKMNKSKFEEALGNSSLSSNTLTAKSKTISAFDKRFKKAKQGKGRKQIVEKAVKSKVFLKQVNKIKFSNFNAASVGERTLGNYGIKSNGIIIKNKDKTFSIRTTKLSTTF